MNEDQIPARWDWRRLVVLVPPYLWLALFFLVPFLIVLKISFAEQAIGIPPYTPLWEFTELGLRFHASFANYLFLLGDDLYFRAYLGSIKFAAGATIFSLLIGYPLAYGIVRAPQRYRSLLLMLVILPFFSSLLIRVYAWIGLLKDNGLINHTLLWLGIIHSPLPLSNNDFAIYLGLVYSYLPFMVLPLYAQLEKLDPALLEAAADLGARPFQTFLRITLPLSLPGIAAGCLLVFIPAVGEFVIPDLLGGPNTLMIGKVLWDEFFTNRDWPIASALAIAMLVLLAIPMGFVRRLLRGDTA